MHVAELIDCESGEISLYLDGVPYSISKDHCNYESIMDKLRTKEYEGIQDLVDIPNAVSNASDGKVTIDGNEVYYNGTQVHNVVVDRIFKFMEEGIPFDNLVLFLENLLSNPSKETIDELYLFLESGHLPITDDGCFLAYKKVNDKLESFTACPDGTRLIHTIGSTVKMPREDVDANRNKTCSRGLHFCSLSYLPKFYVDKGRVIVLKIDPKDVCAIPKDYKNSKGRACSYVVLTEYDSENREKKDAFNASYVNTESEESVRESMTHVQAGEAPVVNTIGVKPDGKKFHNVRGKNGRFTKKS